MAFPQNIWGNGVPPHSPSTKPLLSLYSATVNTQVRPALDGEDCRRVYVMHFWLYYILFIIITITFSYIPTTEISASAQSAAGRRAPRGTGKMRVASCETASGYFAS